MRCRFRACGTAAFHTYCSARRRHGCRAGSNATRGCGTCSTLLRHVAVFVRPNLQVCVQFGSRCARALPCLRHPACCVQRWRALRPAGRHRLPLSRAPAQRRAACCTQQCTTKSEVRLIPGPNPNPRFCAARLRIRAVASGAARCTLQRLRCGARARAPSSSPEALGRCAAVRACTAPRSRGSGIQPPARAPLCAALQLLHENVLSCCCAARCNARQTELLSAVQPQTLAVMRADYCLLTRPRGALSRPLSRRDAIRDFCPFTMVRGPKKHMKRLNAPRHWMLDKLGGVFAPKPAAGAFFCLRGYTGAAYRSPQVRISSASACLLRWCCATGSSTR